MQLVFCVLVWFLWYTVTDASQTVSLYRIQEPSGKYSFGYQSPILNRQEIRDDDGTVRGRFSYIDPYGVVQSQQYIADENGFRVLGTNLPRTYAGVKVLDTGNNQGSNLNQNSPCSQFHPYQSQLDGPCNPKKSSAPKNTQPKVPYALPFYLLQAPKTGNVHHTQPQTGKISSGTFINSLSPIPLFFQLQPVANRPGSHGGQFPDPDKNSVGHGSKANLHTTRFQTPHKQQYQGSPSLTPGFPGSTGFLSNLNQWQLGGFNPFPSRLQLLPNHLSTNSPGPPSGSNKWSKPLQQAWKPPSSIPKQEWPSKESQKIQIQSSHNSQPQVQPNNVGFSYGFSHTATNPLKKPDYVQSTHHKQVPSLITSPHLLLGSTGQQSNQFNPFSHDFVQGNQHFIPVHSHYESKKLKCNNTC